MVDNLESQSLVFVQLDLCFCKKLDADINYSAGATTLGPKFRNASIDFLGNRFSFN